LLSLPFHLYMPKKNNSRGSKNGDATSAHKKQGVVKPEAISPLKEASEPAPQSATIQEIKVNKPASESLDDAALAGPTPNFANGRELAAAMAEKCNLVEVGSRLLKAGEVKGASVSARMFETTVEYLYGKPSAAMPAAEGPPVRIIWDIPGPARERSMDPEDSQDE
jgi:hypothetical protein